MLNHLNISSARLTFSSPGSRFSVVTEHNKRRLRAVELVHFFTVVPITEIPHRCRETLCVTADGDRCNVQQTGWHKVTVWVTSSPDKKLNFWTPMMEVEGLIDRSKRGYWEWQAENVSVLHILLLIAALLQISCDVPKIFLDFFVARKLYER